MIDTFVLKYLKTLHPNAYRRRNIYGEMMIMGCGHDYDWSVYRYILCTRIVDFFSVSNLDANTLITRWIISLRVHKSSNYFRTTIRRSALLNI